LRGLKRLQVLPGRLFRRATVGPRWVQARYGTGRGWVRLQLSRAGRAGGRYAQFEQIDWSRVSRCVFVCRGNVCRSPYAEQRALRLGLQASSFGLRAVAGGPADAQAAAAAQRRGIDLRSHAARPVEAFVARPGDLLIAMEPAQARQLAARFPTRVQITLLGLWARPPRPHLHDPKDLCDRYFDTVFTVIDAALSGMKARIGTGRAR
jgi:protein-tyrosine phosphatase